MVSPLQGIFCPHMIPLNDTGSAINEPELERLIDFLIEKGITGLYPNGSTGEFVRLTFEERKRVIEIACNRAQRAGRPVPVLAGAAEANTDLTVDTLNYYADLGCTAGALIAPFYYKLSQDGVRTYFTELADRSRLPLVLYNIPQFSNEIAVQTVVDLCTHPNIIGIKDSQRDLPRFMNTIVKVKAKRPDFACLIGCEEILLPSLLMGGDGGTIASSGVVPEPIMAIYHGARAGDLEGARTIQFQLLELIETMLTGGDFPEGFRTGMKVRGFNMGKSRVPISEAGQVNLQQLQQQIHCMISQHGVVDAPAACPAPQYTPAAVANAPSVPAGGTGQIDAAVVRSIVERVVASLSPSFKPSR